MKSFAVELPKNTKDVMASLKIPPGDLSNFINESIKQFYIATFYLPKEDVLIGYSREGKKVSFAVLPFADNYLDEVIKEDRINEQENAPFFSLFNRQAWSVDRVKLPPHTYSRLVKQINSMKRDRQLSDHDLNAIPYVERFIKDAIRFYAMVKRQSQNGYELHYEIKGAITEVALKRDEPPKPPAQLFQFELKPLNRPGKATDADAAGGVVIKLDDFRPEPPSP